MTTAAQVLANRLNAQKSTGPRTAQGKAVVAQNATKHGFWSERVVIRGEDQEQFASHRDRLLRELAPAGEAQEKLAERVVSLWWRLQRAESLQTEAFNRLMAEPARPASPEPLPAAQDHETGCPPAGADHEGADFGWLLEDFAGPRVLDKLLMYERRIEQCLYKTMAELRQQRLARNREGEQGVARPQSRTPRVNLATLLQMPYGGSTNEGRAGTSSCGTKPICGAESELAGHTGGADDSGQDEFGETNPIFAPGAESEDLVMAACG